MKSERDALQRHVFPKLEDFCRSKGYRFQAIDLRWGVRDEAGLDQRMMTICLNELKRCQRISPRPNCIVLLGDRYGWRPLPEEIPADEYDRMAPLLGDSDTPNLLEVWYRRDDNNVPPVYVLQPRTGERDQFADSEKWNREVERPLRQALERAAYRAVTVCPAPISPASFLSSLKSEGTRRRFS